MDSKEEKTTFLKPEKVAEEEAEAEVAAEALEEADLQVLEVMCPATDPEVAEANNT